MNFKEFLAKANNYIEKSSLRRWIDGDNSNVSLEDLIEKGTQKNEVEEFLAQISRTIANLMKMKKFVIPNGKVYLPDTYIVFVSPQKDKELQGRMREVFVEGLQYLSEEFASELIGKTAIKQIPITVELKIDGTLTDKSIGYRVQISDSETGKTEVFESRSRIDEDEETIVQLEDETTVINPYSTTIEDKTNPLYYLEIWNNNKLQSKVPLYKREIKIGRPSKTSQVDIELPNSKISRHQLTIAIDDEDVFWIIHYGQNPTKVNGIICNFEEKRLVKPNQKIEVEEFILIINR